MKKVMNVWYGTGENAWLSNLAPRQLADKHGRSYVSVEHAYQTYKSGRFDQATYSANWAARRKIAGKLGTKTENGWNIRLMERLVLASVEQDSRFRDRLVVLPLDVEFTHTQDRRVWRTEFPRILKMAHRHAHDLYVEEIFAA